MLEFYKRKFSDGASFPVLKSLVFFDDAEEDPMPNMLAAFDWPLAKQRIADAVSDLSAPGNKPGSYSSSRRSPPM